LQCPFRRLPGHPPRTRLRCSPMWSPRAALWRFMMDVDFPDDFPDFVLNFTRIHPLTSPLSLLGCLKVELSLVAMKAGCLRAFEAFRGGGGAAVPPARAAPASGCVRGPSGRIRACWAVTREEARARGSSRSGFCSFPLLGFLHARLVWIGRLAPGLCEFVQYTLNSLRSPLTPEELCQRGGATLARLRMEVQLYSLQASATRLTGKHWAAPYASSLLPRSWARARCGVGAFAPAPTARVLASREWCGPGTVGGVLTGRGADLTVAAGRESLRDLLRL